MTIFKKRRKNHIGPTRDDIVPIWSEWTDQYGTRRAICGEDCPACGITLRGSVLLPQKAFSEFECEENLIFCKACENLFRIRNYWEE